MAVEAPIVGLRCRMSRTCARSDRTEAGHGPDPGPAGDTLDPGCVAAAQASEGYDGLKTTVIQDEAEIQGLRLEWDELSLQAASPTIYETFDYVMASWRVFDGRKSDLVVITVRDDAGALVGLAPLRRRQRKRGLFREVVLEYAATVEVDRLGVLASQNHESAVWDAVVPAALDLSWDVWELPETPSDGPCVPAIRATFGNSDDFVLSSQPSGAGLLLDLTQTWEEFFGQHKSFRKRLKRFEREFPNHEIDHYLDPSTVGAGLDIYERIADRSWKPGKVGISKSRMHRAFYDDVMPSLAVNGRSGVRVLRSGTDLIAADITHVWGSTAFFHCAVYDEAFADHSPGTIFTGLVLREFFESSVTAGDLLTGHADYLRAWSCGEVETQDLTVRRQNTRARLFDVQRPILSAAKRARAAGSSRRAAV